jgi:hypothetical protein
MTRPTMARLSLILPLRLSSRLTHDPKLLLIRRLIRMRTVLRLNPMKIMMSR